VRLEPQGAADVAAALDRDPPDEIRISADWNAFWGVVGVRRRLLDLYRGRLYTG
jgi:hypothetical protein